MSDRLMLLDTASLYFRAFYGVPDKVKAPDGSPINAARGLLDMIAKLVSTYQPTHLVACWDDDWRPQWRVDLIPSYKAHRVVEVVPNAADIEEVPDPLEAQIPLIRAELGALGIPIIGVAEHEADDVIGTLATVATMPVDIVTGDRDLFQLVDDARDVRVIYTARGMSNLDTLTEASVVARYGVLPSQYADFATMRGDASDGLPGVAGMGEKTAATLLGEFHDLDGIVAAAQDPDSSIKPRVRQSLLDTRELIDVMRQVVRVRDDVCGTDVVRPLAPLSPEQRDALEAFGARWGLGGVPERLVKALSR